MARQKLLNAKLINLVELLILLAMLPDYGDGLIITSVLAGDKKFKTISFESKFLKPLKFEKDMPLTEFRRHRTVRPPKFDINIDIPIKLPLEEEYPEKEYSKPVESNFFLQTGEITDPAYDKSKSYKADGKGLYASSSNPSGTMISVPLAPMPQSGNQRRAIGPIAQSNQALPIISFKEFQQQKPNARSDMPRGAPSNQQPVELQEVQETNQYPNNNQYNAVDSKYGKYNYPPEFVPGGYVNLQLSGPSGGPKMKWDDYDREKWAQRLSQIPSAMPYPILNYQQLQNYYGGLGTFTNGLAESRYIETGVMDKLKSSLGHITSKFHFG